VFLVFKHPYDLGFRALVLSGDRFHLDDKVHTLKYLNSFLIAREVQTRRGETGPLSPDHLREAYRAYQDETGHVGAARPLRAKKLFVR
jgi:hypothetical protein